MTRAPFMPLLSQAAPPLVLPFALSRPRRAKAHGLATLAICVLLLLLLTLTAFWVGQHLGAAQQVVANDQRSALATEAAEAGLAWAVAQLNSGRMDDDCRASLDTGRTLRERLLAIGADDFPTARASSSPIARCVHGGPRQWRCRCDARPLAAMDDAAQPAFALQLSNGRHAGQFRLLSQGCSEATDDCAPTDDRTPGATALVQHLALLSALRRPPTRSLVEGPGAWDRVFDLPVSHYRLQPALTRLSCAGACEQGLAQAIHQGRQFIWIDGDLTLTALPRERASALLLLVNGKLEISAGLAVTGLIYAKNGIRWFPSAGAPAELRGAAVTDGRWEAAPSVRLVHDAAVLRQIQRQMGSYLPVPGSWGPAPAAGASP